MFLMFESKLSPSEAEAGEDVAVAAEVSHQLNSHADYYGATEPHVIITHDTLSGGPQP